MPFEIDDILHFSDPTAVHYKDIFNVLHERSATLGHSLHAILSRALKLREPTLTFGSLPDASLAAFRHLLREERREAVFVIRHNNFVALQVNFRVARVYDRVLSIAKPTTAFIFTDTGAPDIEYHNLGTLVRRLYLHALIQHRTAFRRRLIDLLITRQSPDDFWSDFVATLKHFLPVREAQLLSVDILAPARLLHPHTVYLGRDPKSLDRREVAVSKRGTEILLKLLYFSRPIYQSWSNDQLCGPYSANRNSNYRGSWYFPLIAQRASAPPSDGEIFSGGAIRLIDPTLSAHSSSTRELTWEDQYFVAFAAEICAVLNHNAFQRVARRGELQRISHGFLNILAAIISNASDVENLLEIGRLHLLTETDGKLFRLRDDLGHASNLTGSINAWAEEMSHQVLFESRNQEVIEVAPSDRTEVISGFYLQILSRVLRMVRSIRRKYQSRWVDFGEDPKHLPNHFRRFPEVRGDPVLLRAVFRNLLENSIKYSRDEADRVVVDLTWEQNSGFAVVSFSDNGIGITDEEAKNLFTRGYRSPRAEAINLEGQGLGLWQARQFMEMMGGRIIHRPTAFGATFLISIPLT